MKYSELVARMVADLETNGDAENVMIGITVAGRDGLRYRLDALLTGDASEIVRDCNVTKGLVCIVADNHEVLI